MPRTDNKENEALLEIYEAQYQQLEAAYLQKDPVTWRTHPLSDLMPDFLSIVNANFTNKQRARPLILDIGCGAGEKTNMIRRNFSLDIVGVDYSENAIARARELVTSMTMNSNGREQGKMSLVKKDLFEWGIKDCSFDGAHDYLAFLHIIKEDWAKYSARISRLLKSGAPLLIVTFSGNDPDFYGYPINQLTDRGIVFSDKYYKGDKRRISHLINSYFYFPTEEELRTAFQENFQITKIEEITDPLSSQSEDHRNRKLWHLLMRRI